MNGDSCLIMQPYTRMHTLPLLNTYTHERSTPQILTHPASRLIGQSLHPHPLTPLLMNQSAGSIHFIAVRPHQSDPFSLSQQNSRGAQRSRGEEGAWNIQTVQRLISSFLIRFSSTEIWCFDGVCMYVCKMREKGLKRDQKSETSSARVCTWYLTFLLPLRD